MRLRLLLLALIGTLAGCDVGMFGRNHVAHPPPKGWEELPLKPGSKLVTFDDVIALDRFCESFLGPANKYDTRARYGGECWIPQTQTLALLSDDATPDKRAQQERRVHGYTHSWGPVHPGGDREWIWPDGRPVEEITPARAQLMVSMAEAEQRRLAQAKPQAGRPIIGGR